MSRSTKDSERDAWAEKYGETPGASQPKKHKYNAQKTIVEGILFDSKGEALRYQQLRLMQDAEYISDLKLQVRFPLVVGGVEVCTFIADYVYSAKDEPLPIVEDFKGMMTPVARLKHKLFMALHPEFKLLVTYDNRRRNNNRRGPGGGFRPTG